MAKKKSAPKKTAKKAAAVKIDAVRHQDKRRNIPTEELRDFVRKDDQHAPPVLYPRDPSLDPQLVWKGKDEQDAKDLSVPTVPIFIQEKIHPQHIIDDFLASQAQEATSKSSQQLELFSDFNGLPEEFEQRVDFYQHNGHWSNRLILGDSLLVMNSLAEKESLRGQVQTIYFDPPYGIKFGSNWQVSTRKRDVRDGKVTDATRQPEQVRAFRDTWNLGIHSYLAYLRDRLVATRDLLTETGSIFVQIGVENMHLVRCVLDEVFGSECFRAIITIKKTSGLSKGFLPRTLDYLLWYSKTGTFKYNQLFLNKSEQADGDSHYSTDDSGRVYRLSDLTGPFNNVASCLYEFSFSGRVFRQSAGRQWKTTKQGMERLALAERLVPSKTILNYKRYLDDFPLSLVDDAWSDISWTAPCLVDFFSLVVFSAVRT
jgi:adenine-specific DNA-methyltransferase